MDNNQQPGNGPNNGSNNNNGKPSKNGQTIMIFLVVTLIALVGMSIFNNMLKNSTEKEITYNKFMEMVDKNEVKKVDIQSSKIVITPKEQPFPGVTMTYYTGVVSDPNLTQKLIDAGVDFNSAIPDMTSAILYNILSIAIPLILIWVVLGFFLRKMSKGGGMMGGVGKSKAKVYVQKETGVTFRDVAGQDEAKESLQEVVDFLENPGKYTKIGAKLPKGALLVGPPGTGKTLLAKAVAGEAHAPFFSLSGSDFVEMFVGVGASRVRDLFEEAKKNAPCIIFIDEIDAIGKSRDSRYGGGNDEREQTLNQLLAEMDGFDTSKGLLILAATNRPEVLDQALLRPGRFDRRVVVDKPDLKGRVDILKVHSKNVLLDDTVDLEAIALATSGAVGSDLANMINEAAILAVKKGRNVVSQTDLFESVEVVLVGKEKKNKILSKEERRIVSYHEVGHALVSALQKDSEPVQKITIVPRTMGALGYVMNVPEEEKFLNSEGEIRAKIIEFVAGRAAEELVFNSVTTGAANDIEQATKLTRAMITQYGMSETFGMMGIESPENQYLEGRTMLNCSDRTAAEVDREVMKVIKDSYVEAKRLLSEHRIALDKIAAFLIEKETITGKEFMKIFHEVEEEEKAALEGASAEAIEGSSQPQLVAGDDNAVQAAEAGAVVSEIVSEKSNTTTDAVSETVSQAVAKENGRPE
ncbi:ATP-dependent zinc metalloprotease FtsH [uncultured Robinsoniella sp.]|uniref:ATP-dependent zinc metalloprotease FtsH n=1 Tax=uncultured Robinsoniella sp. TaxID=904190 RepID=UPI00374E2D79